MKPYSILFCCTGNICRSPTAEAMLAKKAADAGLIGRIRVDSAGTHGYHVGKPPDSRSRGAAKARGYDLSKLRARRVEREDFDRFDLVLAMDQENHVFLEQLCPPAGNGKLKLVMQYARYHRVREVPDPYAGGPAEFELVLDMLEDATAGLLQSLLDKRIVAR